MTSSSGASDPAGTDPPAFLVHEEGDCVAVAVRDTGTGPSSAGYLNSGQRFQLEVAEPIPLGHKIALRDISAGEDLIEYGHPIGVAKVAVPKGSLVHTHNLRSKRWQLSL